MAMKLWLISRPDSCGYDEYDGAVVAAPTKKAAALIHPSGSADWDGKKEEYGTWVAADDVTVEYIGMAKVGTTAGMICSSFNAG